LNNINSIGVEGRGVCHDIMYEQRRFDSQLARVPNVTNL